MLPLIASILSVALPPVISLVEKIRGAKTGPDKFQDVFNVAIALLQALAQRGVGPTQINDSDVKAVIETLVQSMKQAGTLQEAKPAGEGQTNPPANGAPAAASVAGLTLRVKIETLVQSMKQAGTLQEAKPAGEGQTNPSANGAPAASVAGLTLRVKIEEVLS